MYGKLFNGLIIGRKKVEYWASKENDIKGRWKEYFVQLLNSDEIREVGGDIRGERIGKRW